MIRVIRKKNYEEMSLQAATLIAAQILLKPDAVLGLPAGRTPIGTYEELIRTTLPHVKGMILMSPYYMEPNRQDQMRVRMEEYGAIVKKLAEKHGLTFVDLQAGWDRLFQHMHSTNIAWDRIHPNQTGCMYIAKQFLAAVGADRC